MSGLTLVSTINFPERQSPQPVAPATSETFRIDVQSDAYALLDLIEHRYGYPDRPEGGIQSVRGELQAQIPFLSTRNDLIGFAQAAFHALYDHHSITGAGLSDAYSLVPSFADLWVEKTERGYEICDVRRNSPALKAGIRPGARIVSVNDKPIEQAVAGFIGPAYDPANHERCSYAARVLAAGRRDRVRRLGLRYQGLSWTVELPNLYQARIKRAGRFVTGEVQETGAHRTGILRFHDSLGQHETIDAFDAVLKEMGHVDGLILDLRDTASGGNTLVARGILSRFVDRPQVYQRHILPGDQRDYSVTRSWLEEVHPRGPHISAPVAILSGRWTASMGEGMTIAGDALGMATFGTRMAGLLGGITDRRLPSTGVLVKMTSEQLQHVDGSAREDFRPRAYFDYADAPGEDGRDGPLQAALHYLTA